MKNYFDFEDKYFEIPLDRKLFIFFSFAHWKIFRFLFEIILYSTTNIFRFIPLSRSFRFYDLYKHNGIRKYLSHHSQQWTMVIVIPKAIMSSSASTGSGVSFSLRMPRSFLFLFSPLSREHSRWVHWRRGKRVSVHNFTTLSQKSKVRRLTYND